MIRSALRLLFTFFLTAGVVTSLQADPTGLNLIPTADILESNHLRLAYESLGKGQPYGEPNFQYLYAQYAIGNRFEFGIDLYDITHAKDPHYNAKYLLLQEENSTPALAAGVWEVSSVTKPAYYLTAYKSLGQLRLHAGVQTQSPSSWLQFGIDYSISSKLLFMADYQTGNGRYHTIGFNYTPASRVDVNVYYARNNTSALRGTDYVGANIAYTLALGRDGAPDRM